MTLTYEFRGCNSAPTVAVYPYGISSTLCRLACACLLGCFSCIQLCDPVDCSSPGSLVHGILQARILEWVAMPYSRGSASPGIELTSPMYPALQAGSVPLAPPKAWWGMFKLHRGWSPHSMKLNGRVNKHLLSPHLR